METIKPKKLKKGDTIGIISLCGAIREVEKVYNAKSFFEKNGYNVVLSENIFDKKRYLAGEDDKKTEYLNKFFKDDSIDAILCSRGGYGAIRIINKIDYDVIKSNPKIFAGYSDVTVLSSMILKKTGLITFSAPMACSDFGDENISELTCKSFFETLENSKESSIKPVNPTVYQEGEAQGILFGGNLSSLVSLCGVDFIPDEKFIFFAEDLNEDVYRIDKMFHQLLNIQKFKDNLAGIMIGEFLDVSSKEDLKELFKEIAFEVKKPMTDGFLISHGKDKITVPIGASARINTFDKTVYVESYTQS